jgi:hypothetical protein
VSYTIDLIGQKCETCGAFPNGPDLPDPTYNLEPIFASVFPKEGNGGLHVLSGKKASDTCGMLTVAIERLSDLTRERSFRALEPSNRWGTLENALSVVRALRDAAHAYPNHLWKIS